MEDLKLDYNDEVEATPEFTEKFLESSDKHWEKEDPEFFELMKKVRKSASD